MSESDGGMEASLLTLDHVGEDVKGLCVVFKGLGIILVGLCLVGQLSVVGRLLSVT